MIDLINRELTGIRFTYNNNPEWNTLSIYQDFSHDLDNLTIININFCFYEVGTTVINNRVNDLRIELIKTISDEGYCCGLFNEVYRYTRGAVFKVNLANGENIELTTPQKCLLLSLGYLVESLALEAIGRRHELMAYSPERIEAEKLQALKFYAYYCLSVDKHTAAYSARLGMLNKTRMVYKFNANFIDEFLANPANGLRANTNVDTFVREKLIPALREAWHKQHTKKDKSDKKNTIWSKQKITKDEMGDLKFCVTDYLDRKFKRGNYD